MTIGYDERLRKQFVLATATTTATVVFGLAFRPLMNFGVLPLFLAPVMMCATLGSRRAGLIATAVSIPVAAYVFIPPAWSWAIQLDGLIRLSLFAADAVLISALLGEPKPGSNSA
jgi:K+-sensing histidine kinase KdpD